MNVYRNKNEEKEKCSWGDGISIRPDGEHELDPCLYKDVQIIKNATIIVSRCVRCGNISIGWKMQNDTEILLDELKEFDK